MCAAVLGGLLLIAIILLVFASIKLLRNVTPSTGNALANTASTPNIYANVVCSQTTEDVNQQERHPSDGSGTYTQLTPGWRDDNKMN